MYREVGLFPVTAHDDQKQQGGDQHQHGEEPEITGAGQFAAAVGVLDQEINGAGEQVADQVGNWMANIEW